MCRVRVYDKDILTWYNKSEFDRMNTMINHDRDYDFTYAGLRQVMDKYLVQDRSSGEIYETPQQMYMMIAAPCLQNILKTKDLPTSKNTTTQSQHLKLIFLLLLWQV